MGKMIFKAVLMLGIVLGMSNYVMYLMTGKTPFSDISTDFSISKPDVSNIIPKGSERAYKWTDDNGVVHYSSEPPPDVNAEMMNVNPNTNLIQGVRQAKSAQPEPTANANNAPALPQGNVYNPKNVQKLIEDARNVQGTLNERYQSIDQP